MTDVAAPPDVRRRLVIRDADIALAVYEHGFLTTEQLRILFWGLTGFGKACTRRLAQLVDMGVLVAYAPPKTIGRRASNGAAKVSGRTQNEYMLGTVGARMVAEEKGIEVRRLGYKREQFVNPRVREHRLAINTFFTELARMCKLSDVVGTTTDEELPVREWEFRAWEGERGCRARWGGMGNSYGDSADVIPDGSCVLVRNVGGNGRLSAVDRSEAILGASETGLAHPPYVASSPVVSSPFAPVSYPLLLELDRGFEGRRKLTDKAQRYRWLGDEVESAVCFVFADGGKESNGKPETLARGFIEKVGEGRIAATTYDVHVADPFGRHWLTRGSGDERVSVWEV